MIKVRTYKELKEAIALLEEKQALHGRLLKNRVLAVGEELRPSNMVKGLISRITVSPDLKGGLITTAIGLATFYLTKKTLWRSGRRNPMGRLLASLMQVGISNVMARNPGAVKYMGRAVFDGLFCRKRKGPVNTPDQGAP